MMFIYLQRLVFRYVLEYQHVVGHPRRQKYFNIIKLSSHRISNINFPNYSMVAMHVSYSRRWKYLTTNFNHTKYLMVNFAKLWYTTAIHMHIILCTSM